MGCTWGERWNVSHSGDQGVPGEAGAFKSDAYYGVDFANGKCLPAGFIVGALNTPAGTKLPTYEESAKAMAEAAKALERNGWADPYYRRSPRDLAAEVMQLGSLLHTSSQQQAQLLQGQTYVIKTLNEMMSQLVSLRQQICILGEQLADCEARQQEIEKKVPVDPFAATQQKRRRVIKRTVQ
jgi:hypothetical protein